MRRRPRPPTRVAWLVSWLVALGTAAWPSIPAAAADSTPPRTLPGTFEELSISPAAWTALGLVLVVVVLAVLWIASRGVRRTLARRNAWLEKELRERTAELERSVREERRLATEAAQANRAKNAMLATVSHEIRTPMNAILGMNALLLDGPLSSQQRELAAAVQTSAEALLTVVNDLLDLSRIEYGKLAVEETELHLRQVVESAVEMLAVKAQEKGIELAFLVHRDIPNHLQGDPARIRQVLLNLVGNAVRFTDQGEVLIEAILVGETSGVVEVRVEVRDTGIGITPGALGTLFQPMPAVEGSDAPPHLRFAGTGLGLAISERLVQLMGGEIGANSRMGEGSVFWFTLRLPRPPRRPAEASRPVLPAHLARARVLLVDDSPTNRRILAYHLKTWELDCAGETASGAEAIPLLEQAHQSGHPVSVVLLDHTLADQPGVELARRIRRDSRLHTTRLVLLTPLTAQIKSESLQQIGFDAWVTKPVRQSHLFNILQQVVAPVAPTPISLAPLSPKPIDPQGEELAGLRVLIAEDNLPNQVFARRLMLRLGLEATVVDNGLTVLACLAQQPYDLILMDCHMPELDGFEATRQIRASGEPWADIPIIAVTADAGSGTPDACFAAGMNHYVSKPLKPPELVKAIRRVLSMRPNRSAPDSKPTHAASTPSPLDRPSLR